MVLAFEIYMINIIQLKEVNKLNNNVSWYSLGLWLGESVKNSDETYTCEHSRLLVMIIF